MTNNAVLRPLTSLTQRFFEWLARPHHSIQNNDQRRQARLLIGMNWLVLIGLLFALVYQTLGDPANDADTYAALGATITFAIIRVINLVIAKTRYYRPAAYLAVISIAITAYLLMFVIEGSYAEFLVLITLISVMMAGMFLSLKATAILFD